MKTAEAAAGRAKQINATWMRYAHKKNKGKPQMNPNPSQSQTWTRSPKQTKRNCKRCTAHCEIKPHIKCDFPLTEFSFRGRRRRRRRMWRAYAATCQAWRGLTRVWPTGEAWGGAVGEGVTAAGAAQWQHANVTTSRSTLGTGNNHILLVVYTAVHLSNAVYTSCH